MCYVFYMWVLGSSIAIGLCIVDMWFRVFRMRVFLFNIVTGLY